MKIIPHSTRINVYLTFKGNCKEAMCFYQQCLGGELTLQAVKNSPMADQWPAEVQENILHASLLKKDLVLLGSDMGSTQGLIQGNTISLALECSSKEEIDSFFYKLAEGGKITHPLHTFFDGTIGALTDRYGINWVLKL
ncbi:MAG TPA: VOC family protein [Cytophagaceae bacterium]|jgi:PhnB protein|nr:VOC family protein [Cytophagaceae bacterium]